MSAIFEEGEFDNCGDVIEDWFNSCNIQGIAKMETIELTELVECMRDIEKRKTLEAAIARIEALEAADSLIKHLVNEQAEDEGLWFVAETAAEAYLQQELRRLHRLIETGQ